MKSIIVRRYNWRAHFPKAVIEPLKCPVQYVVLTMTNSNFCYNTADCRKQIRYMQARHMDSSTSELPDIAYNFLIGGDGCVYEGRGWEKAPELPPRFVDYRKECLLIAFIGKFKEFNHVDPPLRRVAENLIHDGMELHYIKSSILLYEINEIYLRN